MGLFEKIFGNKTKGKNAGAYTTLTAYQPVFSSYNGKIYESELVRSCIHSAASHTSKLKIEFYGHGSEALSRRLWRPNSLQTWPQFLYRTRTILEVDNTAFVVPVFDSYGRVTEIYPVVPANTRLIEVDGEPWLAFQFKSGKFAQCPVYQVCTLTKFQYDDDFFGSNNNALTPTMELIDIQNQGITEGVKSAATYRFMAQYNTSAFDEDLAIEQDNFNKRAASKGGIALLFPKNYENIKQIESKPFVVDSKEMEQIRTNVFNYYGTNEKILQNKAYGDEWSAYYEGEIETFAIQFSEAMRVFFILCNQLTGDCGVMATSNRLQYLTNKEKLNISTQLSDRGVLNRDEVREIWNLPPLPDGQGKEYIIRGEYKNAEEQISGESTEGDNKDE